MATLNQLTQLIHEKFGIDPDRLEPEVSLAEFGLDSLTFVELIFAVEEHFGIEFPDAPAGNVKTLSGLAGLVDELLGARKP